MQVLQRQGLHPAELAALSANSRAVFGLHEQGQQWAWSRGNFMNVSVGRRARAERPQLLQQGSARQCLAFTASAGQQKGKTPPHGDHCPNIPSGSRWTQPCFPWPAVSLAAGLILVWSCTPRRRGGCSIKGSQHFHSRRGFGVGTGWQSCCE